MARQSKAAGCRVLRVFSQVQISKDCTAKVVELYAVFVLAVSANVNLVLTALSQKLQGLLGTGGGGGGGYGSVCVGGGGRKREIRIIRIHFHHQNDSCIKIGSDVSLFKVSLTGRDKVTRLCPQLNHNLFLKRETAEVESSRGPSASQPNALPLGHTGSQCLNHGPSLRIYNYA